jgi:hypothetical protein
MYMDFKFNTSMDSTYAKKDYTLGCFHPPNVYIFLFEHLLYFEQKENGGFALHVWCYTWG